MFTGETTVRDVLTHYPQAFAIFAAHGMCADCKAAPPPVPLEHFATKHQVNLTQLIGELTDCIGNASTTATSS